MGEDGGMNIQKMVLCDKKNGLPNIWEEDGGKEVDQNIQLWTGK